MNMSVCVCPCPCIDLRMFSSVQFTHSVVSDSLQPHGLQHTRPPCPSPTYPNSCPLRQWCHPTISSSCHPLLLLPSIFPIIRVFSNELALGIRWPKYWSFSFSIIPSKEIPGQSKGLSRVFSNTTVQKHQFFSAQPSSQSNSHIHTWLLEKPQPWLDGPLLAKQCLCFLICCLGWS